MSSTVVSFLLDDLFVFYNFMFLVGGSCTTVMRLQIGVERLSEEKIGAKMLKVYQKHLLREI